MAQKPILKLNSTVKIDGNKLTVDSIHGDYIIAKDKKGKAKLYSFDKVESAVFQS